MRRVIYLLLLLPLLFACNQEDEIFTDIIEDNGAILTKSSVPSPISQLSEIPVNIKLVGQSGNYNFLSTIESGGFVDLYNKDDNSLRQRWYVGTLTTKVVGGTRHNDLCLCANGVLPNKVIASLGGLTSNALSFEPVANTSYYRMKANVGDTSTGSLRMKTVYLHATGNNDTALNMNELSKTGGRDKWEIIPVEDFELVDIKYEMVAGDKVSFKPSTIRTRTFPNNTGTPMNHTDSYTEEYTETSEFSEVKGLSITHKISTSAKVGLPIITAEGSVSTELTTARTWTYTTKQTTTQKKVYSDTNSFQVPPYTTYDSKLIVSVYEMDITYVATLKGKKTGKLIKLEGRWKGQEATHIEYQLTERKSNKVVRDITKSL